MRVSVCNDATYIIPSTRGIVCGGTEPFPQGTACPLQGDVTTIDCHAHLSSFDKQQCVAKEDAICQRISGTKWACVFPSIGCPSSSSSFLVVSTILVLILSFIFYFRKAKNKPQDKLLRRRLSNMGLTTLLTETKTNLSIPISLTTLDGFVSTEEFIDRFQERIESDPFFTRFRSLVSDSHFLEISEYSVRENIISYSLKKQETPLSYMESLANTPFSFKKPLWEVHILHDQEQKKTHFGWKLHHCLGDGAALSIAMIRLSDHKKQLEQFILQQEEKKKTTKEQMSVMKNSFIFLIQFTWSIYVIFRKLILLLIRSEPQTIFKRVGKTEKKLSSSMNYSVLQTKTIGKSFKATINDVMVSCVTGAMRKSLLASGQTKIPSSLVIRAGIPVDMRQTDEISRTLQNKFSSLVIDLPVGIENGKKRLQMIQSNMNEAKQSFEKYTAYLLSQWMVYLPTWVMQKIVLFGTSRLSVVISNVKATGFDVSMCGKRLLSTFAFVPPPPTVNLGIAIISVGDELGLNVLMDPSIGIDAETFLTFVQEEYQSLKELSETQVKKTNMNK